MILWATWASSALNTAALFRKALRTATAALWAPLFTAHFGRSAPLAAEVSRWTLWPRSGSVQLVMCWECGNTGLLLLFPLDRQLTKDSTALTFHSCHQPVHLGVRRSRVCSGILGVSQAREQHCLPNSWLLMDMRLSPSLPNIHHDCWLLMIIISYCWLLSPIHHDLLSPILDKNSYSPWLLIMISYCWFLFVIPCPAESRCPLFTPRREAWNTPCAASTQ